MKRFFVLALAFLLSLVIYQSNLHAYCGAENQAVAQAQNSYDSALEKVREIEKKLEKVAGSLINPASGDVSNSFEAERLKQQWIEAGEAAQSAYDTLESAKSALDLCELRTSTLLGCGHPISSGHTRHQYSCGHHDYSCQEPKHQLRNCPTNRNGVSCEYDSYRMCQPHTHAYNDSNQ